MAASESPEDDCPHQNQLITSTMTLGNNVNNECIVPSSAPIVRGMV